MPETTNEKPASKGILFRPAQMGDVEAVTELLNICAQEVVGRNQFNADELLFSWQAPKFDLERMVRLALTPDGLVVGFCSVNDTQDPYVRVFFTVRVHPEFRQAGIGEALMVWVEERARQAISKAPAGAEVAMTLGLNQNDSFHKQLAEKQGMQIARHFFQMKIEFDGPPAAPELPQGIVIRPYKEASELEKLAAAYLDSFQDHYGFAGQSAENLLENIRFMVENDPHYAPELWLVAMDGDEMAGFSVCASKTTEDPEMGFVNVLGVRRPWRRNGLGLALLLYSFGEFYRLGCKRAGLGVDASSLTGATRLYEKGGMHVERQIDLYKKILREGVDITTTSL